MTARQIRLAAVAAVLCAPGSAPAFLYSAYDLHGGSLEATGRPFSSYDPGPACPAAGRDTAARAGAPLAGRAAEPQPDDRSARRCDASGCAASSRDGKAHVEVFTDRLAAVVVQLYDRARSRRLAVRTIVLPRESAALADTRRLTLRR